MTSCTRVGASLVTALLFQGSVGLAQDREIHMERVRFAAGTTGTTLHGTITGDGIVDYVLSAEAGQTMIVNMTTTSGANYFNLMAPGETEIAFFNGSINENAYVGRLPESGDYTIRVYQMRSAARRQETADYTLTVEITSADYADGLAGGPDFYEVRTADGAGPAELYEAPSPAAAVAVALPPGAVLRNMGCRIAEGQRWCSVERADDSSIKGWVLGEYLRESGYVAPRQQTDALVPGTEFHATGDIPCASTAGQPMTSCRFGVVRERNGSGYLKVFWPDGGNRLLFFEDGTPVRFDRSEADGNAEITVEKVADLFFVRVGDQRFEIPEAVIVGG